MKAGFLDKLMGRLDRLDPDHLQAHILHLAREKGLLETIFHALQEGIVLLDGRGRILYANRAAGGLLGFDIERSEGAPLARFLRDVDWDLVLRLDEGEWSRVLSREVEVNYPEHRFLAFYVVPLTLQQPDERGAVVILRDVTRERQTQAENVESERLRAIMLLAAGVAHEIGNPLNSLSIHLQLLRREMEEMAGTEPLRELVDVCRREVERLDRIVAQFLRAVRPEPPHLESVQIEEVVRDALDFLRHEIADRRIIVEVTGGAALPSVRVDRHQMRQAFFNLIKNAIEAMPSGGRLTVSFSETDRCVVIEFRDSGQGIRSEDLCRVFEPYYTTKKRGTGLGLMIVHRIVRDHGGEIEIQSEPDRGTVVLVSLPREDRLVRLLAAGEPTRQQGADHEEP
jgi:PAS domain S-box-containing protein